VLLFFSRDWHHTSKLKAYCKANNISLIAKSLIAFESVDFKQPDEKIDVIFFSSPRSVDYYLRKSFVDDLTRVACVGAQTKAHLENKGIKVDFYGKDSTEPSFVANDFKEWLGNRFVLFPISDASNRSISKVLPAYQYLELIVYKTIEKPESLQCVPDILVFTSPSNARAFLKMNKFFNHQKVFCFGRTSYNYLKDNAIEAEILSEPSEDAVINKLSELQNNQNN
jgi:uroporphyrinogen-III synthase